MSDLPLHCQLQINQSGSWRGALDFEFGATPPEFFAAADQLARFSAPKTKMRVVRCRRSENGSPFPTGNVLMHWTPETGWVKA